MVTLQGIYEKFVQSQCHDTYNRRYCGIILGRCERESKRDLCQYVRFNTVVRWIDYNKDSDVFVVKAKNLKEDQDIEECFTHVIIATGLFGHAYVPTFPGLDRFQGQIIHAKEVRRAKHFQDKRVLLIGSGLSALDLILQFIKYGASKVIMSYHRQPTRLKMPEGAEERPPVEKFSETKAYFQDGAEAEIDIVIFCTGYRLHHSFLPENLRIQPEMNIYPDHLYKGIVWMKDGNMKFLYLGVLYTTYFLTILDVQALWACQFIMSTEKPTMQEMEADVETYIEERNKVVNSWNIPNFIKFVVKYLSAMIKDTGYQLDVSKAEAVLMEHVKYISEDLSTYRDRRYKSIYTGQLSAKPTLPWMKDFREISDIMSYSY